MFRPLCVLGLSLALAGCATTAPRVRLANATAAELATAQEEREVWYHFKAGDVVPFATVFYGAGFGAPETPVRVQAREDFYLVFRKNMPVTISLNGKSRLPLGSTILLVTPSEAGEGGQVNWITYVGKSAEAERELQDLMEQLAP